MIDYVTNLSIVKVFLNVRTFYICHSDIHLEITLLLPTTAKSFVTVSAFRCKFTSPLNFTIGFLENKGFYLKEITCVASVESQNLFLRFYQHLFLADRLLLCSVK